MLFELARLVAISIVIVFFEPYPLLQTILNLLILTSFLMAMIIIKPYKKFVITILSIGIECCLITSFFGAYLFV